MSVLLTLLFSSLAVWLAYIWVDYQWLQHLIIGVQMVFVLGLLLLGIVSGSDLEGYEMGALLVSFLSLMAVLAFTVFDRVYLRKMVNMYECGQRYKANEPLDVLLSKDPAGWLEYHAIQFEYSCIQHLDLENLSTVMQRASSGLAK
ncbi:MAG: hypothetical protein ABJR46_15395 [Tateyamaria sp.]|uniref:hypothetical protein n=1 Tax=Tateyamaria sp. TaxID=1929288 RepID=UPI00329B97BF